MKVIYSIFLLFIFLTPLALAQTVSIGDIPTALDTEFAVPVNITDAELIAGGVVNVSFNPSIIHLEMVTAGDFGTPFANINNTNGWVKLVAARIDKVNKSQAVLANIVLRRISIGQTGVYISYASLNDEFGQLITPGYENGRAVGQGAPDLAIQNHFIDAYNRNGGINVLGNPATEVHRAWGYLVQDFLGASGYGGGIIIYNTYQKYAYYIHSEIWERYYSLGGPKAKTDKSFELGPPTSDIEPYVYKLPPENSKYGTPFRYQKFEGGNLELNVTSGKVFEVHGGILQKWRELGYAASNLGLPTTDEKEAAVSYVSGLTGRYNVFEGGIIHWIRERNEIFVIGLNQPEGKKIADKYYAEGGSGGWLGFPVSDDYTNPSGRLQVNFEGGYITTTDGTNYVAYPKEILSGPTIKINYPPNNFHTDKQRTTLAGIADSDAPIMRIDARITPVNGNPYYYSKIPYGPSSNEWNTNVALKHGLNIIDVSVADGNFDGSSDSINVYYDEPDFSFVHMTDVHIADLDWRRWMFGLERMNRVTKAINQINNMIPKPDFILITGDLVEFSNDFYFNTVKNLFKDIPTHIVPGNHDRYDALPLTHIYDPHPIDVGLYSYNKFIKSTTEFPAGGYEFIGLDSGPDVYDEPCYIEKYLLSPCSKGLDSLDKLKQLDKITPKIIFMHNPVINKDTDDGSNYGVISQNREELIQYGIDYNVQLVLTGHTHEDRVYNSNEKEVAVSSTDRPLFIQTPSLIFDTNYNHGYRIIEIKDGVATAQPYTSTEYYAGGGKGGGGGGSAMGDFISSNLACPANLHVYDSQGRHTGLNSSGGIETNIPDSFYIGRYNDSDPNETETIFLYNTTEEYHFEIIANLTEEQKNSPENESFNFTMDRQSEGIRTIESFQNITLKENTTATLQVNITTENPNMSLDYNGDTITDETKYPNSIETNYAPTAAIITPEIGSIYNQTEIVEFNGTGRDPEDGILTNRSLVWYSDIDGFIGSGERFSTVNLSAGSHIITLMVNDSMYLYGASSMTITIADTAPPVTTLIPSGTLGNNSWFISDVNVTLKATDTQTGSGVNITEYSFDNATWTTHINPFNIISEGITTVYYRSSDNASNLESTRNQTIKIDKTLPASILNPQTLAGSTYINFTWTNPLDPDFNHVMLFINGTFITNITAPQNYYNFTGLQPDTVYELGTHTVDSSGNVNETWVNKTARTATLSGLLSSTISLKSGWNLISVPLNLTAWELGNEAVVGKPINVTPANCISSLYQYNTTSALFEKSDHFTDWGWWPATGSESFTALEAGRGYWVMAQQDCSLTFTGTAPSGLDISLYTGWNLIGWYSMNEAALGQESVVGNPLNVTPANSLTSIYRYNTTSAVFEKSDHFPDWGWWPATGSESFTKLEPGRGYWVMARNEVEWRHEN